MAFHHQVILITGGSSGIGLVTARAQTRSVYSVTPLSPGFEARTRLDGVPKLIGRARRKNEHPRRQK